MFLFVLWAGGQRPVSDLESRDANASCSYIVLEDATPEQLSEAIVAFLYENGAGRFDVTFTMRKDFCREAIAHVIALDKPLRKGMNTFFDVYIQYPRWTCMIWSVNGACFLVDCDTVPIISALMVVISVSTDFVQQLKTESQGTDSPSKTQYGSKRREIMYKASNGRTLSLINLLPYNLTVVDPATGMYQWATVLATGPDTRAIKGESCGGRGVPMALVSQSDDVDMLSIMQLDGNCSVHDYSRALLGWHTSVCNQALCDTYVDRVTDCDRVQLCQILTDTMSEHMDRPRYHQQQQQQDGARRKRKRQTASPRRAGARKNDHIIDDDAAFVHETPAKRVCVSGAAEENSVVTDATATAAAVTVPVLPDMGDAMEYLQSMLNDLNEQDYPTTVTMDVPVLPPSTSSAAPVTEVQQQMPPFGFDPMSVDSLLVNTSFDEPFMSPMSPHSLVY